MKTQAIARLRASAELDAQTAASLEGWMRDVVYRLGRRDGLKLGHLGVGTFTLTMASSVLSAALLMYLLKNKIEIQVGSSGSGKAAVTFRKMVST